MLQHTYINVLVEWINHLQSDPFQKFSIVLRTFRSPASPSCLGFASDVLRKDGEVLGSSSTSMALEAAGVTTRCLFVPLFELVLENVLGLM